ncbi:MULTISPECIES: DsbC family protein [unclassified Cupriavidus]|uniref:DsbC family protein n=1 Tax=unclassified Cupriavidus TaxID=2640874 RepID=UPI003F93F030
MSTGLFFAMAAVTCAASAASANAPEDPDSNRIAAEMKKMLDGRAEVKGVAKTPIPGLFEVSIGGGLVYTDGSARYIINGVMVDAKSGANLTEERLADLNRIKWSDLPLADALKWTKGNGSRQMAVFSDPNCPYCRRLEQNLRQIDDVTVYTFLMPVLSDDSELKARQIWCAADRTKAWRDWMLGKVAPAGKANCKTPIADNLRLGRKLNVTGTPGVFFADGTRLAGAADVVTLERRLSAERR